MNPPPKAVKLPISAAVGSCDEGHMLDDCLKSLAFCQEILVFDFQCSDATASIARAAGARVIRQPRPSHIELLHCRLAEWASFDWVIVIDPDERVSPALARDLIDAFSSFQTDVAVVHVPWQFYFADRRLAGTVWGGAGKHKRFLAHRSRATFFPRPHSVPEAKDGFRRVDLPRRGENVLDHFWMKSYGSWLEKHRGYIRQEGRDRPFPGFAALIAAGPRSFARSFVRHRGYRDGLTGLFLSLFYAWYCVSCMIESYRVRRADAARPRPG